MENDITVENYYPDSDTITITQTNWHISVWRDSYGEIHINVVDNTDNTQMDLILGQEGYTQKC